MSALHTIALDTRNKLTTQINAAQIGWQQHNKQRKFYEENRWHELTQLIKALIYEHWTDPKISINQVYFVIFARAKIFAT